MENCLFCGKSDTITRDQHHLGELSVTHEIAMVRKKNIGKSYLSSSVDVEGKVISRLFAEIKFCPFCGRSLKEGGQDGEG